MARKRGRKRSHVENEKCTSKEVSEDTRGTPPSPQPRNNPGLEVPHTGFVSVTDSPGSGSQQGKRKLLCANPDDWCDSAAAAVDGSVEEKFIATMKKNIKELKKKSKKLQKKSEKLRKKIGVGEVEEAGQDKSFSESLPWPFSGICEVEAGNGISAAPKTCDNSSFDKAEDDLDYMIHTFASTGHRGPLCSRSYLQERMSLIGPEKRKLVEDLCIKAQEKQQEMRRRLLVSRMEMLSFAFGPGRL